MGMKTTSTTTVNTSCSRPAGTDAADSDTKVSAYGFKLTHRSRAARHAPVQRHSTPRTCRLLAQSRTAQAAGCLQSAHPCCLQCQRGSHGFVGLTIHADAAHCAAPPDQPIPDVVGLGSPSGQAHVARVIAIAQDEAAEGHLQVCKGLCQMQRLACLSSHVLMLAMGSRGTDSRWWSPSMCRIVQET